MSGRTAVDIVLAEFAAQAGLASLELGPDDQVALKIGDTPVVISYVASPTEFVVCTIRIAGIEPGDLAKANAALEMTFITWMNGVMTLGLSETGRDLQGFSVLPLSLLNLENFSDLIRVMIETGLDIRERIAATGDDGAKTRPEGEMRTAPPAGPMSFA